VAMTTSARLSRSALQVLLVIWFALPLVPLLLWAAAESWPGTVALPQRWGVRGFSDAWREGAPTAFLRSLALGAAVAACATPAGALAARSLRVGALRRPGFVAALLLTPVAVPPFAVVMGLEVVLLRLHVPGPVGIVLVLTVAALPYTTYVMRAAYLAYDFSYEEEARILGARPRVLRWRVRVPLLAPSLAAAAFLAFLVGWSDYIVTLLVGGGRLVTLPMLLASAASGTGNEATVAALSLTTLVVPVLALAGAAVAPRRRRARARRRDPHNRPSHHPLLEGTT
jgi:putative spermidine/putrescine transport system permease protein